MNSNCTLRASALALERSLLLDHITRGLGPESNYRKQFALSSAVYTLTRFGRCSDLHCSGANYPGLVVFSG